jgi:hypothetical protein
VSAKYIYNVERPTRLIRNRRSAIENLIEGAGSRIRTDDLLITNQLLYQLSYAGEELEG